MKTIREYPVATAIAALLLGLFVGRSHLFGYASAEECAVHAQTRLGAAACYDLYPRAASVR